MQKEGSGFFLCPLLGRFVSIGGKNQMNTSDRTIGSGSTAIHIPERSTRTGLNFNGAVQRRTPDEEEAFLRKQRPIWDRRRRSWAKRAQGRRFQGGIRHHPARDRETLSRLRSILVDIDHDHAASIVQKLADCIARKSRCRLWICSRCAAERSHDQVERLTGYFADVERSDLAAFTVIFDAIGLEGTVSAEAAAIKTRQHIERLRQKTKRAGIDIGYWGQVELKIVQTLELDDTDHICTTLAELNPSCLEFSEILVPHVHGFIRLGQATTISQVRQFLQTVFPANRQIVLKTLFEDQVKEKAISTWAAYSTKSEVKVKRKEPRKWFADMLSGEQLMIVPIFQHALQFRGGRFSYHLQLRDVVRTDEFDEFDYKDWLRARSSTCKDDQLRKSYEAELDSISAAYWKLQKLHYTPLEESDLNDNNRKRSIPDNGTGRSNFVDCSIHPEPIPGRESVRANLYGHGTEIFPRFRAAARPLAVRSDFGDLGHEAGLRHPGEDDPVPAGRPRPCGRGNSDSQDAASRNLDIDVHGGRVQERCDGSGVG
jgi:hypothetical protein